MRLTLRSHRVDIIAGIRSKIITRALLPGDWVPEESLAAEFGVSRTPIREALSALEAEQLVDFELNRGAHVTHLDMARIRSYFEAAQPIYHTAARLAAVRRTTSDVEALEMSVERMRRHIEARDDVAHCLECQSFLLGLFGASGNQFLRASSRNLVNFHLFMLANVRAAASEADIALADANRMKGFEEMVDALRRGSADDLAAAGDRRLKATRDFVISTVL